MIRAHPTNEEIADALDQVADLLEAQQANPFRVRAYRDVARNVRKADSSVAVLLQSEGRSRLESLPGVGRSISAAIEELVNTGRLRLLERLMGEISPAGLFTVIPGIGDQLAQRIHEKLGVETLEQLELAAHDGRLEAVDGFGPRRARAVRDALAAILSRAARRRLRIVREIERELPLGERQPTVEAILSVDSEYRRLAAAGMLRNIAPRRFNPKRRAWLPILHTERENWSLTAMYSNTAQAHKLNRTRDWIVVFFERDGTEGQCTVVTEYRGPRSGRRVIRGREDEPDTAGIPPTENAYDSDRTRN